jgi:hypothetical protein
VALVTLYVKRPQGLVQPTVDDLISKIQDEVIGNING